MTSPAVTRIYSIRRLIVFFASCSLVALGLCVFFCFQYMYTNAMLQIKKARNSDAELQISAIMRKERESLVLYDTVGTDSLIDSVSNQAGAKELSLELTDISEAGYRAISEMRSIEILRIYGGSKSLSDESWTYISSMRFVRELHLKNVRVSVDQLRAMMTSPDGKLKVLTIFDDCSVPEKRITFKHLEHAMVRMELVVINGQTYDEKLK